MQRHPICLLITIISVFALATPGFAGQLDDYYLAAFAPKLPHSNLAKALLAPVTGTAKAVRSGTPLKHGLSRDWKQLEPATQKVLSKQLALPVLSGTTVVMASLGGHFRIHYTASGSDAPNIASINNYTHLGLAGTADWAARVGNAFEAAYSFYQGLGYHMPPTNPYDVYLVNLASYGEYGETDDINKTPSSSYPFASSSYIQIDKDFTNSIFTPGGYSPLQSLQVTSAHEFHHAIQYGYNYYFDVWYAEVTSTWFEGELYPAVRQNYDYIPGWFADSTRQLDLSQSDPSFNAEAYGRWIFNRHLAQKYSAAGMRKFWEAIVPIASVNGADIPMAPVLDSVLSASYSSSLGAEVFDFAKRVYLRNWPTTTAVTAADVSADLPLIPSYVPVASYASYPVNSSSSPAPSITLPHDSFAYYRFAPPASSAVQTITLVKASGIRSALFQKAGGIVSEIAPNANGTTYTINGFNTLDEVALLLVNSGSTDGLQANFSVGVLPPTGGPYSLTLSFGGSGGGSVNGDMSCLTGAACAPALFAENTLVTLTASPDTNSLFGGWTGAGTVAGNNCNITMSGAKTATASFSAAPQVRILGEATYSQLSAAYASSADHSEIQARSIVFDTGDFICNRPVSVILAGGYNADFSENRGDSIIKGRLLIWNGTLRVSGLTLR
jgi:hypothetical protein